MFCPGGRVRIRIGSRTIVRLFVVRTYMTLPLFLSGGLVNNNGWGIMLTLCFLVLGREYHQRRRLLDNKSSV